MSTRTGVIGIIVCMVLLLLTVVVATGVGPELPGPHVRDWVGLGEPPLPDLCELEPGDIRRGPGKPIAGHWRIEHNSPLPSPEAGAVTIGRYVYMVGGQDRKATEPTVLRFDPATAEYRREPDAPVAIDHPVVAAHDGEVILASGFIDGSEPTNRMWSYSPRTRKWTELPPMRTKRGAAAGVVVGDRLYVAGGITKFGNENWPIPVFEIYDFGTRRWRRGPDMPTARHHFGVGVVGGKLYFAGGRQPTNQSLDAFQEFDPANDHWRRLPPVPIGTGSPGVTAIDGRVVVAGGGEDPVTPDESGGWTLRATYAYDPRTGRWIRLPDMRQALHGLSIAALGNHVYVFRGIPCPGYGETSSAESLRVPVKWSKTG
jgi:non-specific serine/threonine protein kinase